MVRVFLAVGAEACTLGLNCPFLRCAQDQKDQEKSGGLERGGEVAAARTFAGDTTCRTYGTTGSLARGASVQIP